MDDVTNQDLEALGYVVTWFRAGHACVVWDETEHWIGEGHDEHGALRAAVAAMLPSRAARVAVEAMLADRHANHGQPVTGPEVAEPSTAEPAPAAPTAYDVERPASVRPTASPDLSDVVPLVAAHLVTSLALPTAMHESASEIAVRDRALADVNAIARRIEDAADELPRMAPEIQRLTMFVWLARARELQDNAPHDDRIYDRVAKIAWQLGGLAKVCWPGNIAALKRESAPQRSLSGLCDSNELQRASPRTWGEAADAAEAALEKRVSAADFDDGWSDTRCADGRPAEQHIAEADLAAVLDPRHVPTRARGTRARRTAGGSNRLNSWASF